MLFYSALLHFLVLFNVAINKVQTEGSQQEERRNSKTYQVDRQKLRELWYSATLRGLIKGKSKESLSKLPEIDGILFRQCELDASSAVHLARCAMKLFKARGEEQKRQEE